MVEGNGESGMNQKRMGRASWIGSAWLSGAGAGILWTLLGATLAAWLVDSERMPMESVGYLSMGVWLTGGWITARMAVKKIKENPAVHSMAATLVYFLCLLLVNALFYGGKFHAVGITAGLIALGWGLSFVKIKKGRGGSGRNRYKIPK